MLSDTQVAEKVKDMNEEKSGVPHIVIIGGGFGGLYAAKALAKYAVKITLIDKRNFHLFQPLLYQVATGTLSPGDIASPLRSILSKYKNITVLLGEAVDIDPDGKKLILNDTELHYDSLIVATGASHHYFGNEQWQKDAPGLKTVEDALEIRRRIFAAFEAAEKETDPAKRQSLLTFVIVGAGPSGVELAGALAELAYHKLPDSFRNIDTNETRIFLIEGLDRVLPPFPSDLSAKAKDELIKLGVQIKTQTMVTNISNNTVTIKSGEDIETISTATILWAAGVKASGISEKIAEKTQVKLDRAGRIIVDGDLSIPNYPDIFVVGDLANFSHQNGQPLPGVAPVAMQEGDYVAKLIMKRLKGESLPNFHYTDYGSLAVIGRNQAVVNLNFIKFAGFPAWVTWLFIHIYYMIEFDNKLIVMIQWAWSYLTRQGGSRLITGKDMEVDDLLGINNSKN
jgi:NADH dehydrogenase